MEAVSHSWEVSFKPLTHTGPHASNEKPERNRQEKKNYRGIIILFFFAVSFRFYVALFSNIQTDKAQSLGLTGII